MAYFVNKEKNNSNDKLYKFSLEINSNKKFSGIASISRIPKSGRKIRVKIQGIDRNKEGS